jgi:hypothetical protein
MLNIPEDSNIGSVSIQALADAVSGSLRRVQLPSFQRDAVWGEEHVEKLWDSIVRSFPIGTLLFARVAHLDLKEVGIRPLQDSRATPAHRMTTDSDTTEFVIIDGQQRSIAVSLGLRQWQPGDSARLWIDLGGKEDAPVRFHVCSLYKPWGRESTAASERSAFQHLTDAAKDNYGRVKLDKDTLNHTWPVAAACPVPMAQLLQWLQSDRQGSWIDMVPAAKKQNQPRVDVEKIFARLLSVPCYQIPVFLVNKLPIEELGEVFQRLNSQGYAMSGEELFFSALKMSWPGAHDLVWDIYTDSQTGRFLQPTQIVHLAVRLVALLQGSSDVLRLDQDEFTRRIRNDDENAFIEGLKKMLQEDSVLKVGMGRLHHCLCRARQLLQYQPDSRMDDPGLPVVLLARLRWRVWHALAAWLYLRLEVDEIDRLEMIRYALLDHFYGKSTGNALVRLPFRAAFTESGNFPGYAIYQALFFERQLESEILSPSLFQSRLGADEQPPASSLLNHEYDIGLYIQRRYFHQWYENFDPTLYHKQRDLPYDADHILPKAYKNMQGIRGTQAAIFWQWRDAVMNSPGNFRYWPSNLNRSDQMKNLRAKWLLGPASQAIPEGSYLRNFGLTTVGHVRTASYIGEEHINHWERAAHEQRPQNWRDPERMQAFRQAVDKRRLAMYSELYAGIAWECWVHKLQESVEQRIVDFICASLIKTGRELGHTQLIIRAGNLHEAMALQNQLPAICRVLDSGAFLHQQNLLLKQRRGSEQGADAEWELELK